MKVSLIIVYYHAKEPLFACLDSLKAKIKFPHEVIVVDNDEKKTIDKEIKKSYPWVTYLKSPGNAGFGAGNNLGAHHAKGEYLFFLNPDTIVSQDILIPLVEFLQKNKKAAIVAPLLLDPQKKTYPLQGTSLLTPLRAIFSLSFINKFFPNNSISKKYLLKGWDKTKTKEVDVIPGTAFMIRKKIFAEVNGFDEHFFLYFEENDLCKRVKERGHKIFITPGAKLIHLWGKGGTQETKNINAIFAASRWYYFKKHYGFFPALLVQLVLSIRKVSILMVGVLVIAAILLFYRLSDLMIFIGDQGFFYISARDMLLSGYIPLVGITSSHVWLHQGPFWTYLLAGALWIGHFNPVSGAYLSSLIGLITVFLVYKIGSEMFSQRVGILASMLYSTLPLVVFFARMPYHTEPIALLTLLFFYALFIWTKGYRYGVPLIIFLLAVLYNFEISTFMLFPIFLIVLGYGIAKKTSWIKNILNKKIILLSLFAFLLPMIPMILYDIHHGYPQTIKFVVWIGYKIATIFGFPKIHPDAPGETYQTMLPFATEIVRRMVFYQNALFAWLFLGISFINLLVINIKHFKKRELLTPYSLLFLFFIIPAGFYVAEKTNSDAYWIVFFPTVAFMFALVFDQLMRLRYFFYPAASLLAILVTCNIVALFRTNFLMDPYDYGNTLSMRVNIAKQIVQQSHGQEYNLIVRGFGSQYPNVLMNYEYLTWWFGHGPSTHKEPLGFLISETLSSVSIHKEIAKKK